jgi:hypothetical protein
MCLIGMLFWGKQQLIKWLCHTIPFWNGPFWQLRKGTIIVTNGFIRLMITAELIRNEVGRWED